jgi:hypothetical protein
MGHCFSFPSYLMDEQGWFPSELTQTHLQDVVSQGFMTAAELTTFRVLEDPVSPIPVVGYVVAYTVFYERGFCVPSH